jgi:hypothetical protein
MIGDQIATAAIAGSALLTALLYAADIGGGVRAAVVVVFLLLGPGLAFVRLLRFHDPMTVGAMAIGASVGLNVVVGTVLLAVGLWTPGRMIAVLVIFTLVCVAVQQSTTRDPEPARRGPSARQRAMAALAGTEAEGGEA